MNELSHRSKTVEIFNTDVINRTRILDTQITNGSYYRGYFFLKEALRVLPKGANLLDYGCGSGRISKMLAESGFNVVGIDPAKKLIEIAKNQDLKNLKIDFQVLLDEGESLKPESYDGVICSSAIEFCANPEKVLEHLQRSLKNGASTLISFSNPQSLWRYYSKIRFRNRYDHFSVQKTSVSYLKVKKMLEKVGFSDISSPIYFESAFDKYPLLKPLNKLPCFGTLFLVICKKQ